MAPCRIHPQHRRHFHIRPAIHCCSHHPFRPSLSQESLVGSVSRYWCPCRGHRFFPPLSIALQPKQPRALRRHVSTLSSQSAHLKDRLTYRHRDLCIVLSPATFLAFNYIVYGRLIVAIDDSLTNTPGLRAKSRYSLIPPRLVGRLFVWSDVITFLIQASGGGLEVQRSLAKVGSNIFLGACLPTLLPCGFFSHPHPPISWNYPSGSLIPCVPHPYHHGASPTPCRQDDRRSVLPTV